MKKVMQSELYQDSSSPKIDLIIENEVNTIVTDPIQEEDEEKSPNLY